MINTTNASRGRFGNILIVNMLCSQLAKKYNLKFEYKWLEQSNNFGLCLYSEGIHGSHNGNGVIHFQDDDFVRFMTKEILPLHTNVVITEFHQTPSCARLVREYVNKHRESIHTRNLFQRRYNNNNDVFVHVRLGDAIEYSIAFEYYDYTLAQLTFDNGYISSDTIDHPLCRDLIAKYGLKPVDVYKKTPEEGSRDPTQEEIQTIMFGSTCRYLVLSGGSFSWIIGLLSNPAWTTVFFHKSNREKRWFGDIFVFPDWVEVDYPQSKIKDN
jgi:hypothetical protein